MTYLSSTITPECGKLQHSECNTKGCTCTCHVWHDIYGDGYIADGDDLMGPKPYDIWTFTTEEVIMLWNLIRNEWNNPDYKEVTDKILQFHRLIEQNELDSKSSQSTQRTGKS